ncbi:hypothetical protein C8K30_1011046 [Promicromonospora sp. AC04]|uniref:hypothetical protein n=1 Tax=Promicromonospora sp. AC04 TaxID=2135723 RepID=UPI000D354103|nr:hypothetical protein [Promicromonospora sp. AC04]PUB32520.1 hypothetical protein C8K30_1011046 [Promicromonospora sp. AC04]
MRAIAHTIAQVTHVLCDHAAQPRRLSMALADLAREQRTTNLLLRAQIATDPTTKARLLAEVARRMDGPR